MPINEGEFKIYDPYDAYLNEIVDDKFKFSEFNNKIRKLSRNLFDFNFDTATGDFLKDRVSIPLGLNQSQSQELAKVVMELIIAEIYLGNVVEEIKSRLGVDDIKAKTIAGLVVTELFAPILEDLKKMHVEKFAKNMPKPNQQADDRVVDLKNNL